MANKFQLKNTDPKSLARLGLLTTPHSRIATPCFMPIATVGAMKGAVETADLKRMGARIILGNTYHLHLRPGEKVVKKLGGLQSFMNWGGSILTDSGGYQVFSLGARNKSGKSMVKLTEDGVEFRSHLDGHLLRMRPEDSMDIQLALGSDIIMVLDECPPYPSTRQYAEDSMDRTSRWALRCLDQVNKKTAKQKPADRPLLFSIVQGAHYSELRQTHAEILSAMDFDGYAIGGLAVGEPADIRNQMLDATIPYLPEEKPRYLMGVGTPVDILEAVERGVDMFDCVLPTRNARHGQLYTRTGVLRITNKKYETDKKPIDTKCKCTTCRDHTRAYLRHLFIAGEDLGKRLASIHNLHFYLNLMEEIREAIELGKFRGYKRKFLRRYQ